jgi:probable phosphoglycerate mutase
VSGATLWLVRHGETEWSRDGRHTGRTDLPLTELGREQARAVAEHLAGRGFALVLTSPLQRAVQTAHLAGLTGAQPRDDLMEVDYGEYEGLTTAQVREHRPGWTLWRDGCPGGETVDAAGRRADRVIAEALHAGGDVALVAHGHLLRILAARWLEQPAAFGERLKLDTARLSVLGWERDARAVARWNA